MKTCPRCGEELPLSEFKTRSKGGPRSYCIPCEWKVLHHDPWASYATYLYDQQTHGECPECLYAYDDPDEGCDACRDKKVTP